MAPFVLVLMYILAPIAWPTAQLLDWLLGEDHGTVYKKAGLKTLVSLHKSLGETGQQLNTDEVTIISAVLDLKDKSIGSIMTPMDDVFTMSLDDVLDEDTMDVLLSQGYSRIPIHHPDNDKNFVGMLLVKMLITYDPEDAKPVREFALATLPETRPDTSCLDIVNFFQEGKSHMVLVSTHPGEDHGALGVVTLEDVIEELIGEEIVDESDVFVDVSKAMRRMTPAPRFRIPKGQVVEDNTVATAREPDLIDISEDNILSEEDLQREKTADSLAKTKSVPQNRRRSSATDSNAGNLKVPARNNTTDIREHLKHLGPSNLASRPKTTRYNTVKIKPGTIQSNSPAPANGTPRMSAPRRISESMSDYHGGIGEGLLSTAGKAASDGVQALQQYGSFGSPTGSPADKRSLNAHKAVQARPESLKSISDEEGRARSLQRAASRDERSSRSRSTVRSLKSNARILHSRGPARSGSITENIIDVNGVRKIVLETMSSGDSAEENGSSSNKGSGSPGIQTKDNASGDGPSALTRSDGDKFGNGEPSNGNETKSSKTKRRRKKQGGAKSGENQPLLG
jgi:metal transporter CNNM